MSSPDAAPPEDRWRTLAHPLRSRLLAHLRLHGAASGAELARELGTNTGATSYHLRVLEDAGLVEDTGLGNAKTRVWAIAEDDDEFERRDADQADFDGIAVALPIGALRERSVGDLVGIEVRDRDLLDARPADEMHGRPVGEVGDGEVGELAQALLD